LSAECCECVALGLHCRRTREPCRDCAARSAPAQFPSQFADAPLCSRERTDVPGSPGWQCSSFDRKMGQSFRPLTVVFAKRGVEQPFLVSFFYFEKYSLYTHFPHVLLKNYKNNHYLSSFLIFDKVNGKWPDYSCIPGTLLNAPDLWRARSGTKLALRGDSYRMEARGFASPLWRWCGSSLASSENAYSGEFRSILYSASTFLLFSAAPPTFAHNNL